VILLVAQCAAAGTVFDETAELGWLAWSRFLTLGDGPRCRFEPTCSRFARDAVRRDGPWGVPLGLDRLARELNWVAYPDSEDGVHHRDLLADHPSVLASLTGCRRQRALGAELCTLPPEEAR
jgi:hypothetical protein